MEISPGQKMFGFVFIWKISMIYQPTKIPTPGRFGFNFADEKGKKCLKKTKTFCKNFYVVENPNFLWWGPEEALSFNRKGFAIIQAFLTSVPKV